MEIMMMNEEQIKGKMTYVKGKLKEAWGDLTDDELMQLDGKKDQLAGTVTQKYGVAKDEFEKKIHEHETAYDREQEAKRKNSAA